MVWSAGTWYIGRVLYSSVVCRRGTYGIFRIFRNKEALEGVVVVSCLQYLIKVAGSAAADVGTHTHTPRPDHDLDLDGRSLAF